MTCGRTTFQFFFPATKSAGTDGELLTVILFIFAARASKSSPKPNFKSCIG